MFYVISKVVWFFATPSNSLVLLAILGVLLMRTRRAKLGFRLAIASAALLFIAGLSPLANALMLPLEQRFPAFVDDGTPIAGVVVLGGTFETDPTIMSGQMALNETGERILAIGDLARRYPNAKIIYTSGGSEFAPDKTAEATLLQRNIGQLGLAPDRVIFEDKSLNTFQNALYSEKIAAPKAGERWLLVTSAFHMPRAIGVFRAVGFKVTPYPVDFRTTPGDLVQPFAFVSMGLRRTDVAAKEWIGLLAYYLTGQTAELFPGPQSLAETPAPA